MLVGPWRALLVVRPGTGRQPAHGAATPRGRPARAAAHPDRRGWTRGRIGWVFTMSEAVPALALRAESIDATLLFAKTGERDRVAALVAVDRD